MRLQSQAANSQLSSEEDPLPGDQVGLAGGPAGACIHKSLPQEEVPATPACSWCLVSLSAEFWHPKKGRTNHLKTLLSLPRRRLGRGRPDKACKTSGTQVNLH